MNIIFESIHNPLAQWVGWALLHSIWQGALIGGGFWLSRMVWRQSASKRYAAGCVAMFLMAAMPISTVLCGLTPSLSVESSTPPSAPSAIGPIWTIGISSAPHFPAGVRALLHLLAEFLRQLAPFLATAWAIGVIFFSLKLVRGYLWIRHIRFHGNEPVEAAWVEVLDDLRCRLEIYRAVRLVKSALIEVPTVIGWLRPVILLPAASLIGLTPGQLEAILAHELAHVRRFDYLINVFQCLLETLMFYHPVTRWISSCVREERENCCDDLVVKVCGDRLVYAHALAALEEFRPEPSQWAFAANGGSLVNRIRRLLGVSTDNTPSTVRQAAGLAVMGLGLLLIFFGIYLVFGQETYRAWARIKLDLQAPDYQVVSNGKVRLSSYDPNLIQSELEVIQSEAVLGTVIQALNLNEEWGKRYARVALLPTLKTLTMLRARLHLRPVRNASLLEIGMSSERPGEAATIANEIAESYRALRLQQNRQIRENTIKALEDRWIEQDKKVKKTMAELDGLRVALKLPDSIVNETTAPHLMNAETLRKIESLRIESSYQFSRENALVEELRKLPSQQLAKVIPTAAPDALLSSLLEQLYLAEQSLLTVTKDYGPEHIEVIKCSLRTEDLRNKIKERTEGIMLGLEQRVASLKVGLDNLNKEIEKTLQQDIDRAEESRPYFEKKQELEDLSRFRQILGMKIAAENVDLGLVKNPGVEIVDRAETPLRPYAPNRPRAAALILVGMLLELAGLPMLKGTQMKPSIITDEKA